MWRMSPMIQNLQTPHPVWILWLGQALHHPDGGGAEVGGRCVDARRRRGVKRRPEEEHLNPAFTHGGVTQTSRWICLFFPERWVRVHPRQSDRASESGSGTTNADGWNRLEARLSSALETESEEIKARTWRRTRVQTGPPPSQCGTGSD